MDYNDIEAKLYEYSEQIALNLYDARTSILILHAISEKSSLIEEKRFDRFFFHIQRTAIENALLSLMRVFDTHNDAASLQKIMNYMQSNIRSLNKRANIEANDLEMYTDVDFNSCDHAHEVIQQLKSIYDALHSEYEHDLNALKSIRDKRLAHSEVQELDQNTTWETVERLCKAAIEIVFVIENTLLATHRDIKTDSLKPCKNLAKLMTTLDIIDDFSSLESCR